MKTIVYLIFAALFLGFISCEGTADDQEMNECINSLKEKGHTQEEAQEMCEGGEALKTIK